MLGLQRPSRCGLLSVLAAVLIVAGCRTNIHEDIRCEDVLHPALSSVSFDKLDTENAEDWIAAHFPHAVIIRNGVSSFGWGTDGKDFNAYFDAKSRYLAQYPGGRLYNSPESTEPLPTVADILRCFGRPDLYALQDIPAEVPEIGFSMWYLKRGLIFQTVESKGFLPKKFDITSKLTGPFIVVPPGSADQMASNWWTTDPTYIASLMAELKPWPENFQVAD